MERIRILAIMLCAGFLISLFPAQSTAQNNLERISANERSDGKGFVVRYHLEELVDSFKVVQPSTDLIQIFLFSSEIDTLNLAYPSRTTTFSNYQVHKLRDGLGIDIFLEPGKYFSTRAYPDQNGKDLLLALEYITADEIDRITESQEPVSWAEFQSSESFEYDFSYAEDNTFLQLRNNMDFSVIVIDPGHGGHDPGTINRSLRLFEKDIALAVALKLGAYIEEHMPDVKVVYTRTDDTFVPLTERGLIATRAKGDLFVSIHVNAASNPNARGTETFFLGLARSESALEVMKRENSVADLENGGGPIQLSEEELLIYELTNAGNMAISERIAYMIEDQFNNRAQRRSRGVKQAGLQALWNASTPAVLIELGFLSNPQEARFLASDYGQTIMASAIFRAIRDFKLEYDKSLRQNNRASREQ